MSFREVTIADLENDGSILAIQDGNHGEKHPKATDYVPEGVPFIMASDIRLGYVDVEGANKLPQEITDRLRIGFCQGRDVLLSHKGSVGYVALAPDHSPYLMLTPQVTYYRVDEEKLSPEFLSFAFKDPLFQKRLASTAGQQGTRGYVGIRAQRQLKVHFADPPIQKRLVDLIKPYDDLIENNRRRMTLLEDAARQLYREWFVRMRFPGHEHTPIINGVPEGWEDKTLGELCEEVRESVHPDALEPDTPYIGLGNMPRRSISLSEWGAVEQVTSNKHRFNEGDILFGKIRPYFHKVGIAFVDGVASSDAIVIRPLEPSLRGLVLMTVSSDPFVAMTAQTMKEGSKMPRADWKQMQTYPAPRPPVGLLDSFETSIQSIVEQLKALTFTNQKLAQARDLLLPRLMSGELAV